jgi:hypothetical protein
VKRGPKRRGAKSRRGAGNRGKSKKRSKARIHKPRVKGRRAQKREREQQKVRTYFREKLDPNASLGQSVGGAVIERGPIELGESGFTLVEGDPIAESIRRDLEEPPDQSR